MPSAAATPTVPHAAPRVSVVTPFYNVAQYLAECIESVLKQTYGDFEYILLDNCSTDGSSEIAHRYAEQDKRIKVFRNEQLLAQVPNYNAALARISSSSRYTKVVEADNWIYPECLEKMVALGEAHPQVGIISSYNITEQAVRFAGLPYSQSSFDGREIARRQLRQELYVFAAPTTVMMRSELVRARRPFYDESAPIAEDQSVCFDILKTWDFGFIHQVLSFIRTSNISILSALRGLEARSLDLVLLLQRHGKDFLDPSDYVRELERTRAQHYRALARSILLGHGTRLMRYHREGLALSNLEISRTKLAAALAVETFAAILSPRRFANARHQAIADRKLQQAAAANR